MFSEKDHSNDIQIKKCTKCAEEIKIDAKVCRYCKAKQKKKGSISCGGAILLIFFLSFVVSTIASLSGISSDDTSPRPQAEEPPVATTLSPEEKESAETELEDRLMESKEAEIITSWTMDGIDNEILVIYVDPRVWATVTIQNKRAYIFIHGKLARAAGFDSMQLRDAFTDKRIGRYGITGQVQLYD